VAGGGELGWQDFVSNGPVVSLMTLVTAAVQVPVLVWVSQSDAAASRFGSRSAGYEALAREGFIAGMRPGCDEFHMFLHSCPKNFGRQAPEMTYS
jgi:hypothetical protein